MPLRQLRRVRWAVRAALALGVAASVAANVLHAEPNLIAQTIAAWPPLALLFNVELISRVPMHRRHLAGVRLVATAAIAGIAAWVSYWHMVAVAARYGETGSVPFLLPISVDGLVIVASVSLVELAGRIRLGEQQATAPAATPTPAANPTPVPVAQPAPAPAPAGTADVPVTGAPLGAGVAAALTGARRPGARTPAGTSTVDDRRLTRAAAAEARPRRTTGQVSVPTGRTGESTRTGAPAGRATSRTDAGPVAPRPRRPVAETLRLIEEITAERPHATDDELADALGITLKRLRTVRAAA